MFILFFVLLYTLYKIFTYDKIVLTPRKKVPKICIYIRNKDYVPIIENLYFQNYPKELFDVYIKDSQKFSLDFSVEKYNRELILSRNYDVICIIDDIIDINYLKLSSIEYLKGYDIIVSKSSVTSVLLLKRMISSLFSNKIYDRNFSFSFSFFKENIFDLDSDILSHYISTKSNFISYSFNIKTFKQNFLTNKINVSDKRFFMFNITILFFLILIIIVTNNLLNLIVISYCFIVINNIIFLYKNNKIELFPVLLIPFNLILYLFDFILNNKRSDV